MTFMDYRTIVEKHPDRYVIAAVAERGENNFVSSWEVLSADSKSFNEAKEKLKFFESEGVKGCCIINTYADASDETEAGAVARMFRLMYTIRFISWIPMQHTRRIWLRRLLLRLFMESFRRTILM